MTIAYKLTDSDGYSKNNTYWDIGTEHTVPGGIKGFCGYGWLHAYRTPILASLMYKIHVSWQEVILWECDVDVAEDLGDKLLCTRIKVIKKVKLPKLSTYKRVKIFFDSFAARERERNSFYSPIFFAWLNNRKSYKSVLEELWTKESFSYGEECKNICRIIKVIEFWRNYRESIFHSPKDIEFLVADKISIDVENFKLSEIV